MKKVLIIPLCFLLFGCDEIGEQENSKQSYEISVAQDNTSKVAETSPPRFIEFDIHKFHEGADSLIKALKNEKYYFKLISDTFKFGIDNPESFTKGHGFFWLLYRDSSESIVRHYLHEPSTKGQLRIYIVEADYNEKEQLEQVIVKLENTMNELFIGPDDGNDSFKMRLSPTNDYVITSDNKLLWLNMSYPYANQEVLKFIDCLKFNVDTTKFNGRIICLFGSDCSSKNVP